MAKQQLPTEKLQKVLARAGIASRREAERWINSGRLKINGSLATIGDRVSEDDRIELDGKRLRLAKPEEFQRRVIAYHKPEGQISSRNDPEGRKTVFDNLPRLKDGRWIAIGRLDYNTTGLMLFTNDGQLANTLMHPSAEIDREYLVRVMGTVDEDKLKRMRQGVLLEDGEAKFTDIVEARGEEDSINRWFYVCLMEGKNREVRRLWESQDCTVSRLKRTRFGPVFLPAKVRKGQWTDLSVKDIKNLIDAAQKKEDATKKKTHSKRR